MTRKEKIEDHLAGLITVTIFFILISWVVCIYQYSKLQYEMNFDFSQPAIIKYEITHSYTTRIEEISSKLTVKERLLQYARIECKKRGLSDDCVKDLEAMAWKETKFIVEANGDSGLAYGLFQINRYFHSHITPEQAQDISFSIKWTLDRMQHYGYPEDRDYAIMKHNGTPYTPNTLKYLYDINSYINN